MLHHVLNERRFYQMQFISFVCVFRSYKTITVYFCDSSYCAQWHIEKLTSEFETDFSFFWHAIFFFYYLMSLNQKSYAQHFHTHTSYISVLHNIKLNSMINLIYLTIKYVNRVTKSRELSVNCNEAPFYRRSHLFVALPTQITGGMVYFIYIIHLL